MTAEFTESIVEEATLAWFAELGYQVVPGPAIAPGDVQVRLAEGTVWLTQKLMADLYGKDVRTINEHLENIYEEGELDPEATIRKFRIVQTEGNRSVSRVGCKLPTCPTGAL
jgi:hypothetical protein